MQFYMLLYIVAGALIYMCFDVLCMSHTDFFLLWWIVSNSNFIYRTNRVTYHFYVISVHSNLLHFHAKFHFAHSLLSLSLSEAHCFTPLLSFSWWSYQLYAQLSDRFNINQFVDTVMDNERVFSDQIRSSMTVYTWWLHPYWSDWLFCKLAIVCKAVSFTVFPEDVQTHNGYYHNAMSGDLRM